METVNKKQDRILHNKSVLLFIYCLIFCFNSTKIILFIMFKDCYIILYIVNVIVNHKSCDCYFKNKYYFCFFMFTTINKCFIS